MLVYMGENETCACTEQRGSTYVCVYVCAEWQANAEKAVGFGAYRTLRYAHSISWLFTHQNHTHIGAAHTAPFSHADTQTNTDNMSKQAAPDNC